jgi:NAD(P)-dependent dehydrogenase (short-subunit alcohol dehydrogenase family)
MKRFFITGCNRGIGLGLVKQLSQQGHGIIAGCRYPAVAAELQAVLGKDSKHKIITCDLSSEKLFARMANGLAGERIDVLINNAAVYGGDKQSFADICSDDLLTTMRINMCAPLLLCQLLKANLKLSRKAALNAVMRSAAFDLAAENIRVLTLHPGWVKTDMGGEKALLDVDASAKHICNLIENEDGWQSGEFYNYDGKVLPW